MNPRIGRSAWQRALCGIVLAAAATSATAETRFLKVRGTSAGMPYSYGFSEAQTVCLPALPVGAPASDFVTAFIASINGLAGTRTARPTSSPSVFQVTSPGTFEFWVSTRCPALQTKEVTNSGGAPIAFNPTIEEVFSAPSSTPTVGQWGLAFLVLGFLIAGTVLLTRTRALAVVGVTGETELATLPWVDPRLLMRTFAAASAAGMLLFVFVDRAGGAITRADAVGSLACLAAGSYLIHLWILVGRSSHSPVRD